MKRLLVLSLFLGCGQMSDAPPVRVAEPPVGRVVEHAWPLELKAAQRVTPDRLYIIYSRNLIEGATPDQRFLDRPVLVEGVVDGVRRAGPGQEYLELRTRDAGVFVYAQPVVAGLSGGQRVRLLCRGAGMAAGSPMLTECRTVGRGSD